MKRSNKITEVILFSSIYILLLLMTFYLPVIGIVSMFLFPIPFIIYTFRHGFQSSILMLVITSILTVVLITWFSLPITLMSAIGGITIGTCLNRNRGAYETWAIGSVAFSLGFIAVILMSQWMFDLNIIDELNQLIEDSIEDATNIIEEMGTNTEETILLFEEQVKELTYLIPTIIGFIGVIFSFLSMWIGFKIINRMEKTQYSFPPFRKFNLPTSLVWYYFIAIVIMWIETDQGSSLNQAASNISMFIGFLLVLQGLSFIAHYVHVKNKSKGILVTAIILLILLPLLFMYPLRILGIIDIGFKLRDRLDSDKR